MAVISIRLNSEEEKMVSFLSSEYEKDKSSLIKFSLKEMYEDYIDKKAIEDFEKNENDNLISFVSSDEILKQILN